MPLLIDQVRHFIAQHNLIRSGTRVVAALSGGSDSVALASMLHQLNARGELELVGLAHFNHQLRATADRDEQAARVVAASLGVPMLVDREDVAARARAERRSTEDAARAARYAFFARARQHFRADAVALGHTRDDQAETFLLRLLRGAGPRGLAAMHPRHDWIVRPLLACRRDDLRAWLQQRHADGDPAAMFVDDETNADVSIPRNRVRAELLPLLKDRFNPNIVDVLGDEAELAREMWAWLEEEAERFGPELQVSKLRSAPQGLRRLVLWRALTENAGGRPIAFDHVTAALRLIDKPRDGDAIDLPGQRVQRIGGRIVLTARSAQAPPGGAKAANLFRYPLSIPGEVALPQAGCVVTANAIGAAEREAIDRRAIVGKGPVAVVRGDLCGGVLTVRNRRPGDRFRPVGIRGKRKLQDFFVDRKVARGDRDAVPLVVDEADRIVWVAGYGIDEAFRVTDPAQHVLLLRLRRA